MPKVRGFILVAFVGIVEQTVKDIVSLKIQGATNVRKKAVSALVSASQKSKAKSPDAFRKEFLKNAAALFNSRPTEPELRTAIRILKRSIAEKTLDVPQMKKKISGTEKRYESDRKEALRLIASYGSEMIQPGSTILTLCHSSSVVQMLIKAKNKIKQVYCCETRPLYQGRITAKELSDAGIKVTLIIDNAASTVLKECDYFFTGADAFLADGDVINKIGTNQISTLCKRYDAEHYAVCSSHKFEPDSFFGKDEPIEHRNPHEVFSAKEKGFSSKIKVLNPAFDRTDASFVEGIICELGVFPSQALAAKLYDELELDKKHREFMKL